jgi:hypothetical protein
MKKSSSRPSSPPAAARNNSFDDLVRDSPPAVAPETKKLPEIVPARATAAATKRYVVLPCACRLDDAKGLITNISPPINRYFYDNFSVSDFQKKKLETFRNCLEFCRSVTRGDPSDKNCSEYCHISENLTNDL